MYTFQTLWYWNENLRCQKWFKKKKIAGEITWKAHVCHGSNLEKTWGIGGGHMHVQMHFFKNTEADCKRKRRNPKTSRCVSSSWSKSREPWPSGVWTEPRTPARAGGRSVSETEAWSGPHLVWWNLKTEEDRSAVETWRLPWPGADWVREETQWLLKNSSCSFSQVGEFLSDRWDSLFLFPPYSLC